MPAVSDIRLILIGLKTGGEPALSILLAADGSINRLGSGSLTDGDRTLYIGVTKEPLFENLVWYLNDEILKHTGTYDVPEKRGVTCELTIGLGFADETANGFKFRYGSDSTGVPREIRQFVRAALQIADPWFEEQKQRCDPSSAQGDTMIAKHEGSANKPWWRRWWKISEGRPKARAKAQQVRNQQILDDVGERDTGTFSITERTLTLDEYRTERFEPFPFALWHWHVLDDAFLATHEIGHVLVLDLTGGLVGVKVSGSFRGRIRELVEQGERTIVVNLKGLTMISAHGLGELSRAMVRLERAGGMMAVVNAPQHFRQLMARIKSYLGERASVGPSTGGPARM